MKGDPDTKHLVKEIYVYSDGSERVIEIKPNPLAAEISAQVSEAMLPQDPAITASELASQVGEASGSEVVKKRVKRV